jgi:copper chaperone CopZ
MDRSSDEGSQPVELSVLGMTCAGCAKTVTRVLSGVPGVAGAKVDFASGRAVITGGARPEDLIAAITAAGYGAQPLQNPTTGERNERGRSGCC